MVSTAGVELERFDMMLQGIVLQAPGDLGKAVQAIEALKGVTATAKAKQVPRELLPLPVKLSEEERSWTDWALGAKATSSRPWIKVQAAGKRSWLWLLILAINVLSCGA